MIETIKQRIKPPKVEIEAELKITLYAPDGVDIIKTVLTTQEKAHKNLSFHYEGGGRYKAEVIAEEWKTAEKTFDKVKEKIIDEIESHDGIVSMERTND